MNDLEQRTTLLLDTATTELAPDVDLLVGGGIARGRVLRRRRRIGTTFVAAAVLGVVGSAASLTPALDGLVGGGADSVVDPPAASAPPTPSPARAARRIGMDVAKTAAVLESLLPAGDVRQREVWHSEVPGRYQGGRLLFDGGVVMMYLAAYDTGDPGDPGQRCRAADGSCSRLPTGDWLMTSTVEEGAEGQPMGTRSSSVSVFTVDGYLLSATAYNPEKHDAPVSTDPVLSIPQLRRIALDPVWLDDPQ